MISDNMVEVISEACHAANREIQSFLGEEVNPVWGSLSEDLRESTRSGVVKALYGLSPERLHVEWMAERSKKGWVLGERKDVVAKTHPCMVPYHQLPPGQQLKDKVFYVIARSLGGGLWGT